MFSISPSSVLEEQHPETALGAAVQGGNVSSGKARGWCWIHPHHRSCGCWGSTPVLGAGLCACPPVSWEDGFGSSWTRSSCSVCTCNDCWGQGKQWEHYPLWNPLAGTLGWKCVVLMILVHLGIWFGQKALMLRAQTGCNLMVCCLTQLHCDDSGSEFTGSKLLGPWIQLRGVIRFLGIKLTHFWDKMDM